MNNQQRMFALMNDLEATSPTTGKREGYLRAPFGYAGSKSRSVKNILPHLPYRNGYIEPFGGSGAILLARDSSPFEVFNDRHAGIVALYRCIHDKDLMNQLMTRLSMLTHSREEFLWCKETWTNPDDIVERAARWFYMVHCSFGSLCRNFGRAVKDKHQTISKMDNSVQTFHRLHQRIRNVLIENQDWRHILQDFDDSDHVFYLDPPYMGVSGGIYKYDMNSEEEHREMLNRIFELKGFVALSGYENPLYNEFPWDEKHHWEVSITIKSQAQTESNNLIGKIDKNRTTNTEMLWIKR